MLRGSSRSGSFGHSGQTSHWQSIIDSLNNLLKTFQQNYVSFVDEFFVGDCSELEIHTNFLRIQVPAALIQKIFTQIFSFINMQLFNRWYFNSSR